MQLIPGADAAPPMCLWSGVKSRGLVTATSGEGMSGGPTGGYHVLSDRNSGSPTGREPYGDGIPVVVGGTVMGATWRRGTGINRGPRATRRCAMHGILKKRAIFADRASRGLKLERVYRELYEPEHYLQAYGKIYRNRGAMTPGVDGGTADGTSLGTFRSIIASLEDGSFDWKPTK